MFLYRFLKIIQTNVHLIKECNRRHTLTAEDTELTSHIIYVLVDKLRGIEQLWNISHKYHDSRELKITIMYEINMRLLLYFS